jgi:hypothetical protein
MNTPPPSHHGQSIVDGEPPRFEITLPVPRHGEQGLGSAGVSMGVSVATARSGYPQPAAA